MVGYRNRHGFIECLPEEFIRHSDGGVSEHARLRDYTVDGVYQAFRWWGIGTGEVSSTLLWWSLSGIPMVGYRNGESIRAPIAAEFIRHSDGGVSEHLHKAHTVAYRVYQAFRWWGIGTIL